MPLMSEMLPSRFLKKEDVPTPALVTIQDLTNEVMDKDSGETKWAMSFAEFDKPLAMNSTNLQACASICNSQDSDDWLGKQVVVYHDPNVSFGGKLVGGIRIRAAKKPVTKVPEPTHAPVKGGVEDMDSDIPFSPVEQAT